MTYKDTKAYPKGTLCSVEDCNRPVKAKGLCNTHYQRIRLGRAIKGPVRLWRDATEQEWFDFLTVETEHGILWVGNIRKEDGYGRFNNEYAHRFAWRLKFGIVPEDMELDHDPGCPKNCVTIEHLTPRTKAEHTAIGWERGELDGGWSGDRARTWTWEETVNRSKVFEEENGICGICNEPADIDDWHLDHIIPLSKGGQHTRDNVQVSHPICNMKKNNRIELESSCP